MKTLALVCLVLFAIFGWGPNWGLLLLSLSVLFAGSWLCWRPGEPGVALILFLYQWVQASIAIFVANLQGLSINALAQLTITSQMGQATALTLAGLLAIFVAFRLTAGKPKPWIVARAREDVRLLTVRRLAVAYAGATIAAIGFIYAGSFSAGLAQPMLALAALKDAMFIIIAYAAFTRGGGFRTLFFCVFAIELAASLGSYFSTFQLVFLYTLIAAIAANVRISAGRAAAMGLLALLALSLGVVWSAIKEDYRAYLNGGTGLQVVTVPWSEAVVKLANMVATVDHDSLVDGADRLRRRLTYVEFFASSLDHVPAVVPHTKGEIWGGAVLHPFTPRMLFPDKPAIDASVQTNKYSGINVAGREQGAQISIGYMGESYIDFGRLGMFVPLLLYGATAGFIYRRVLTLPSFSGVIAFGLCVPLLLSNFYLNAEAVKIVGALAINVIVIFALHAFCSRPIRWALFGNRSLRARHSGTHLR